MIAAVVLASAAVAGTPNRMVETTLPNGLEVTIVVDASMPLVATQVWYHVGSANESKDERGLAHLFEHMMFGATDRYALGDYSKSLTAVGGDDNAYTSPDETVYVAEAPGDAYVDVLRREGDRMRHLAITPENLDNEKKIVIEELRMRGENDPVSRLLVEGQKALLGEHPYAYDATGSKADVAAATVERCRSFYDRYYRPNNAQVVVVGPVDPDGALSAIQEAFGAYPRGGETPPDVPPLDRWKFPGSLELKEDIPPVEVALVGAPLPPADASDAAAVEILVTMLAERSVDPVREYLVTTRHKAIEAGIRSIALRRGGGIVFYSASLPYRRRATAEKLLDQALAQLDGMAWNTPEALAAAKRKLLLARAQGDLYAESLAGDIGRARWWEGDTQRAFDRETRLDAVTADQVAAAWRKYVRDASKIRVYVKPEHVPAWIRMFGWLYPLFS